MTTAANAAQLGRRLPSADERETANQLRRLLAAHAAGDATLNAVVDKKAVEVTLGPTVTELLIEVLRHVGNGEAVTLVPVGQMLSTQQAADILNVSRPHLVSLLERKIMPFTTVGRHRRVRAEDLFRYKQQRDASRSEALTRLAASDGELL